MNCSSARQTAVQMTDPDDEPHSIPDDPEALGSLKESDAAADTPTVEVGVGLRSRWHWNPVTEAGGTSRAENEAPSSGFEFDLGRALARLGDDESVAPVVDEPESVVVEEPESVVVVEPESVVVEESVTPVVEEPVAAESAVAYEPLQTVPRPEVRQESIEPDPYLELSQAPLPRRSRPASTVVDSAPTVSRPVPQLDPVAARQPEIAAQPRLPTKRPALEGSVFDAAAPAPVLPPRSSPGPVPTPRTDDGPLSARVAAFGQADGGVLPTLPAANPVAPPPIVAPIQTAPSTPDLNAVRSAQLRTNRPQQRGRVLGRSVLAFVVIGVLIAGALFYGRSYLFPTEWDAELTPIVDDVQKATGAEFDHTVELITLAPDEYADGLLVATLGTDWSTKVPEWRALGLASGDVTADGVAAALAARTAAYYDPIADAIYRQEGRSKDDTRRDLEGAVVAAFHHQRQTRADDVVVTNEPRLTGVSTPQSIARGAVDAYLANRTAEQSFTRDVVVDQEDPVTPIDAPAALPIPIAYELAAIEQLGEPILTAAGVDPATLTVGASLPAAIYGVLDDNPVNAPSPLLRPGEQPLADSAALGGDDWALVWGSRLPGHTVDRLSRIVTADSYRPVSRGTTTCFVAVLQTANETAGTSLFSSMLLWAQRAPIGSEALATQLGPTQVQLEACDPGAEVVIMPDMVTVDALVERQISRLIG